MGMGFCFFSAGKRRRNLGILTYIYACLLATLFTNYPQIHLIELRLWDVKLEWVAAL